MKKLWVAACFVLASCVDTSSPEFIKSTEQKCLSFGFQAGSNEMANCRMNTTMLQDMDNARRRRAVGQALSEAGDEMNANAQRQMDRDAYIAAHRPVYQPTPLYQPHHVVNCTSRRGLNTIETRCQ